MAIPASQTAGPVTSREDFGELFAGLRTWGTWGTGDSLGALNYLAPARVRAAASMCALGIVLLDCLALDDLARVFETQHRWEFPLTVAPLVLRRGTGTPVNPSPSSDPQDPVPGRQPSWR